MATTLLNNIAKVLEQVAKDDLLHDIGLEKRNVVGSAISTFGIFAAGLAVGAAAGLLFAPKPGTEMREDLAQRMTTIRTDLEDKVQSVMKKSDRYNPPS